MIAKEEDLFTEFVISLFLWYTIQTSLGGTATNGTCRFCHPPTVQKPLCFRFFSLKEQGVLK